jgi:hypothetical protein
MAATLNFADDIRKNHNGLQWVNKTKVFVKTPIYASFPRERHGNQQKLQALMHAEDDPRHVFSPSFTRDMKNMNA